MLLAKFGAPVLIDSKYETELSPNDGEERGREGGRDRRTCLTITYH